MSSQSTPTLWDLARVASDSFEVRTRDDGSRYVALPDDAPVWVSNMVQAAHQSIGGLMLPDDRRYALVSDACDFIAENPNTPFDEVEHDFADDVDVYTADLLAWLSSHNVRLAYCDEATETGFVFANAGMEGRMRAGQYLERREVFLLVCDALNARADELDA